MEEINIQTETSTDQTDLFLEGLEDAPATADQPERQAEQASAEEDFPTAGDLAGDGDQTESGEDQATEETTGWRVVHMGEERTLRAEDVTPALLQKGLDYDRIRSRYEEAKPVLELCNQYAAGAGMSVADFARHICAQAQPPEPLPQAEDAAAGIRADLANFAAAFPEVYDQARDNPKAIPQCVWDAMRSQGLSLTAAYARYATTQARAAAGNQSNAARSTGSMRSAGNDAKNSDPFLSAFDA